MKLICEMIIDWKVDVYGDPGEEICCTRQAVWTHEGVLCCPTCAKALHKEGLPVEPLDGAVLGGEFELRFRAKEKQA